MRAEPEEKKRSPHTKLSGLDKLVFSRETVFFLSACCQENQAPGVALRLVTEKYVLRTPSFAIGLQNTVWPINGSDYQPA